MDLLTTNINTKSTPEGYQTIDWNHPLSNKLQACWIFNQKGGGFFRDLTGINHGLGAGKINFYDGGLDFSSTGACVNIPKDNLNFSSTDKISFFAIIRKFSTFAGSPVLIEKQSQLSPFRGWVWQASSTGIIRIQLINDSSNNILDARTTRALEIGKYYNIISTYNGSNRSEGVSHYINGIKDITVLQSNSLTLGIENNNPAIIGAADFIGSNKFQGSLAMLAIWRNRELTNSDVNQLNVNPYCFLNSYFIPVQGFIQQSLTETLIDNFNDNVIDPTKWVEVETGLNTVTEANQQLEFDTNVVGGTAYLASLNYYDLRESFIKIKVADAGNQALASLDVVPMQFGDLVGGNLVEFDIQGNTITANYAINSSYTTVASDTYNSTTHKWLRIRESGGTTFWEISSNGTSWNSFASIANPVALDDGQIALYVASGIELGTTKVIYDNFNVAPSATTVFRRTLSGLGTRVGSRQVHRWSE